MFYERGAGEVQTYRKLEQACMSKENKKRY